jgi:hypothetical protein
MWSIWPSYQKPLLLSIISRSKKSEKEKYAPLRSLVIVYEVITWDKQLSTKTMSRKIFAYVRLMFSATWNHNTSKLNELVNQKRYMRKLTYLANDYPATKLQNFLFYLFNFFLLQHHAIKGQDKKLILAWKHMSRTWHKHQWPSEGTQTCYHLEVC